METHLHIPYLRELIVYLIIAGLAVPLLRRAVSPVLGYLLIGGIIGPFGLGLLADDYRFLDLLVISDLDGVRALAEIGVVFLLFTIGLELSFQRLWTMRRLVFGLGSAQIVLSAIVIGLAVSAFGMSPQASLVLGACLALSSTAIVMQLLIERGSLGTTVGRTVFGVLLMQDLAVIPILFALSVLGTVAGGAELVGGIAAALGQAALTIAIIYVAGRLILRPVFRIVAQSRSREAFMAVILLLAIGTAVITSMAGLSMALGAFLAGLLIAETEYRHQVEVDVEPFKGLLLGLFFMSVGMGIDWRVLGQEPLLIAASVAALMSLKTIINIGLMRLWKLPMHSAVEGGLLLSQGGEFAFIVVGLAMVLDLVPTSVGQFVLIVAGLTMLVTPAIAGIARRLGTRMERHRSLTAEPDDVAPEEELEGHVVIAGFGRVGRTIAAMLEAEHIPYVAIDLDARQAAEARAAGLRVRFGDASRFEVLHAAKVEQAAALVVTLGDAAATKHLTDAIRQAAPKVPLYVRASNQLQAAKLLEAGAALAISETHEVSLQLAGRILTDYGLSEEAVQDLIEAAR